MLEVHPWVDSASDTGHCHGARTREYIVKMFGKRDARETQKRRKREEKREEDQEREIHPYRHE